ncbi:hypothetical protein ACLQ90_11845 [Avibacterium paragallinarum]|uniref:Uncharacterized protein n=1 Tax=Avibacterium paragallinarum TaxID=728 RepID=A0AAE5TGA4_AVIPA|nr:hypothetical protein [Avibacterium paragallinarum]MEE3609710.1 hypothetical protein [Avibacterium paragallinarum]MEE3621731.1 hypothetical protein [Avibacterium paragallinarum]MEE3669479.1 hypothetical protein [Avibacterium paragallinarum]MEE3681799.1 hypothetical protein [Avibacterium paragallinarum]MEE4387047.1 hypothetical protein [Avibacterium paragallinarum]
MIKVRRLDHNHDWTFGQGRANYADHSEGIAQNVQCRLWSFANDWFLDLDHGLPWIEKMGRSVDLSELEMQVKKQVLETEGVKQITHYQSRFDPNTRKLTLSINYLDIYGLEHRVSY